MITDDGTPIVLSANIEEAFSAFGRYFTFKIASKSDQQLCPSPAPVRHLPDFVLYMYCWLMPFTDICSACTSIVSILSLLYFFIWTKCICFVFIRLQRWACAFSTHVFQAAVTTNNGVEAPISQLKHPYTRLRGYGSLADTLHCY